MPVSSCNHYRWRRRPRPPTRVWRKRPPEVRKCPDEPCLRSGSMEELVLLRIMGWHERGDDRNACPTCACLEPPIHTGHAGFGEQSPDGSATGSNAQPPVRSCAPSVDRAGRRLAFESQLLYQDTSATRHAISCALFGSVTCVWEMKSSRNNERLPSAAAALGDRRTAPPTPPRPSRVFCSSRSQGLRDTRRKEDRVSRKSFRSTVTRRGREGEREL